MLGWYDPETGSWKTSASKSMYAYWDIRGHNDVTFGETARALHEYDWVIQNLKKATSNNRSDFATTAYADIRHPLHFKDLDYACRQKVLRALLQIAIPNRKEKYPYGSTSLKSLREGTHPGAQVPIDFWDSDVEYKAPKDMTEDEMEKIFKAAVGFCGKWDPVLTVNHIAQRWPEHCVVDGQPTTHLSHYGYYKLALRLLDNEMGGMIHILLHTSTFVILSAFSR